MNLDALLEYLEGVFPEIGSREFSNNGLQVEGQREVHRLGFAVDASMRTFEMAWDQGVDFLFVHHGISWGNGEKYICGAFAKRLKFLLEHGISLYGCHLPLDAHDKFGNNAVLAKMLHLQETKVFAEVYGMTIGRYGILPEPLTGEEIVAALQKEISVAEHHVIVPPGEPSRPLRRLGIVSGSGADCVEDCRRLHLDGLLTGEIGHAAIHPIWEAGIPVIAIGHYASETVGVRAFMRHVEQTLNLSCCFLDVPTGF